MMETEPADNGWSVFPSEEDAEIAVHTWETRRLIGPVRLASSIRSSSGLAATAGGYK